MLSVCTLLIHVVSMGEGTKGETVAYGKVFDFSKYEGLELKGCRFSAGYFMWENSCLGLWFAVCKKHGLAEFLNE